MLLDGRWAGTQVGRRQTDLHTSCVVLVVQRELSTLGVGCRTCTLQASVSSPAGWGRHMYTAHPHCKPALSGSVSLPRQIAIRRRQRRTACACAFRYKPLPQGVAAGSWRADYEQERTLIYTVFSSCHAGDSADASCENWPHCSLQWQNML